MENVEKVLINYILNKAEEATITHEEIEDLLLIKSRTSQYYSFMRNIDKQLLTYSKGLKVIKGIGYKILGSEAIIDKALKMAQKGQDKLAGAVTLINGIDRETLNEEYKLKFDIIQVKFIQVHANLAGGIKELILLDNKKNKIKNRIGAV